MAEKFNFDDAYATDSCDEDTWEGICRHVGLSYGESDDEQDTGDGGSKDGQEGTDVTVEGIVKQLKEWMKQLNQLMKLLNYGTISNNYVE